MVMAPLPMFHRPLSMDSRDTSLSNSSGRPVETSVESGSGFSLPMRSHKHSLTTPESPSNANGDYLVPNNDAVQLQQLGRRRLSSHHGNERSEGIRVGEHETSFTTNPPRPPPIRNQIGSPPSDSSSSKLSLDVSALRSQMAPKMKYANVDGSTSSSSVGVGSSIENGEASNVPYTIQGRKNSKDPPSSEISV